MSLYREGISHIVFKQFIDKGLSIYDPPVIEPDKLPKNYICSLLFQTIADLILRN